MRRRAVARGAVVLVLSSLLIAHGACDGGCNSGSAAPPDAGETVSSVSPSPSGGPSSDAGAAAPPKRPCPNLANDVDRAGLERHLQNFMQIAKQHDGNRGRTSGGYDASVAYVVSELRDAGLTPTVAGFAIPAWELVGPGALAMVAPTPRLFLPGRNRLRTGEFTPLSGSPPGNIRAEIAAVGIELGAGNRSQSGCRLAQFDDGSGGSLVGGKIALLQRGECPFADKVRHAQTAGALGVIVFNQGDQAAHHGLMRGAIETSGNDSGVRIPVMFTTTSVGQHLMAELKRGPVSVELAVDSAVDRERVDQVVTDLVGERDDEILTLGAHLDSVARGPGINDNASGAAALLVLARQLAGCKLARTVRLAWWGGEEEGLLGSTAYVDQLNDGELRAQRGYINLDMLAAPNHAFMLTDGDGSTTGAPGPATSAELEKFFTADFAAAGIPLLEVRYAGRSDDKPFFEAGVGVVMLGAGYDGKKTPKEVALFGGKAGQTYDPCYHRKCDDMQNVNLEALLIITRSVARAVQHFGVDGEGLRSGLR